MKRIFYLTLFITSLFFLNTINVSAFSSENNKNRKIIRVFTLVGIQVDCVVKKANIRNDISIRF